MQPRVTIESVQFVDGTEVSLHPNSALVLTGPNNVGKSVALNEIYRLFQTPKNKNRLKIIKDVRIAFSGDYDDFSKMLKERNLYDKQEGRFRLRGKRYSDGNLLPKTLKSQIERGNIHEGIRNLLMLHLSTGNRIAKEHSDYYSRNTIEDLAGQAFDDESAEVALSEHFWNAFRQDLILNRNPGSSFFAIGQRSSRPKRAKPFSKPYREWLSSLEAVTEQGDGVRAYARILIKYALARASVFAVDEPELFLHPPQARSLATLLGRRIAGAPQLIVSTHDSSFVQGIVDSGVDDLQIVRIERNGAAVRVRHLDNEKVARLTRDPFIRTSNALSGLFHRGSVVCEGETDARFLRAMIDAMPEAGHSSELHVQSCGGKGKAAVVGQAIAAAGIPVAFVFDLDVIGEAGSVRRAIETNVEDEGKQAQFLKSVDSIKAQIDCIKLGVTRAIFRSEVERIFGLPDAGESITDDDRQEIRKLLSVSSPWRVAKDRGVDAFAKQPQIFNPLLKLLEDLREHGIFVIRTGELESLCSSIPRNSKAEWLQTVLQKDLLIDSSLEQARLLVGELVGYFASKRDM